MGKGKLRILYECAPMAMVFENAGGQALDSKMNRLMEVVPAHIHADRVSSWVVTMRWRRSSLSTSKLLLGIWGWTGRVWSSWVAMHFTRFQCITRITLELRKR